MTNSIENATLPKTTKPYNPKSWVQIQIRQDFEFEFVLRETKESVFFDLLDLGSITFSVESVINIFSGICHNITKLYVSFSKETYKRDDILQ